MPVRPAAARVAPAGLQVAVGVGAHVLGAGCLPTGGGLLLSLPLALGAVLALGRLLPDRPLLRIGAGQLAVHGSLAFAACTGVAEQSPLLMTSMLMMYAHVVAVVALRAAGDRVVAVLNEAVRLLGALVVRAVAVARGVLVPRVEVRPAPRSQAVRPRQAQVRTVRWRGPPALVLAPLPG